MSRYYLIFAMILGLFCHCMQPVRAIDWDDAGNDPSKLWDDNGNWNPDGDPDGLIVNIGNLANAANDTTLVDRAYTIDSLTITNGADVVNSTDNGATNDFELVVNGLTTISDAGSTFFVIGGDPDGLDTQGLTISNGGTLNLNSTTAQGTAVVEIESGVLDLNADGTIIGQGRIDFDEVLGAVTTVFSNDGTLTASTPPALLFQAPAAGTLQVVSSDPDARFDWDGVGAGILQVNGNQTLDIDVQPGFGAAVDAFSGTMNLNTGGTIDISNTWSLDTGAINVNTADFGLVIIGQDPNPGAGATIAGADWTMSGGTITLADTWDTLILESNLNATGGTASIAGVLQVDGTTTFGVGADLSPTGASPDLVINGTATINQAAFNWDGFETTTVNDGALLTINSASIDTAADGFDGTLNINGGAVNVFNAGWNLEVATINMDTSTSDSDISGNAITVNSDSATINVIGGGVADADINVELIIDAALDVNIDPGTTLDLGVNTINVTGTTWDGGAGSILRNGIATINAITTYNLPGGEVDLDDGNDILNAQLTINADRIDTVVGDGYDGTLTINNTGTLLVNLTSNATWQMDGTLTYSGDAASGTIVGGNSPVEFQPGSIFNVNGEGAMLSRVIFEGTVNINSAGEDVELFGGDLAVGNTNEINGATINGPGALAIDDGQALRGSGIINAPVRGDGNAQLIAQNGLLDFNGVLQDMGTLGTSGATAVLDMQLAWNTNVTDTVVLNGGEVRGAAITNDGVNGINGFGLLSAPVNNNTRIDAEGGTLIVQTPGNNNNWDGVGNVGSLTAVSGNLEIRDNAAFLFLGTVRADSGREVFANGFELEFDPGSNLNLNGGTYRATNATDIGGTVNVGAGTANLRINGTTIFENGSSTTLTGDLQLDNPTTRIVTGATFAGGGSLINLNTRTLDLADGAVVGVVVENEGVTQIAAAGGVGRADANDFLQTAAGQLSLDLGGTGVLQSDRLVLSGAADLAGTLALQLVGGYVPALNDTINIITANGGFINDFDTILQPLGIDPTLRFTGNILGTIYQLEVVAALPGDFDNDGDIDGRDFLAWQRGESPTPFSAGDLADWQAEYNGGLLVAASVAVPEPGGIALFAAVFVFGCSIRGQRGYFLAM